MRLKVWVGVCAILLFAMGAVAQDKPKMSAEEKAAMDAMMKAGTPGEAHKKLSAVVGTFNTVVKMYGQPGTPAQESTGTSENKWVLGGRWVQQSYSGNFMGMDFSGIGYTGYDNIKKQYVGTWMDNMSTSVMVSMGSSMNGKTYEFNSSTDDPMTGKAMPVKSKMTVVDDDHHTMEMWGPAPDGKMYKMMEITYTRKK